MLGQRLKLARSAAGLSLRGLEERIGNRVTAQAIGKYERDESMPSSGVLIALADALSVPVDYLVGDQEMALESLEFRKKSLTSKREETQVEAKSCTCWNATSWSRSFSACRASTGDKPREAPYPVVNDPSEADRAAHSLRLHWGLGLDPIPNLVELLEERGIKVLSCALGNIDGLMARVRRAGKSTVPVLVVNDSHWGERQRLTMAHELGHIVLEVDTKVNDETAAFRFAGAFLMPAEVLWAAMGKHRTSIGWSELFALKKLFGVSVQALTYRCKDLGIFGPTLFRRLFHEFFRLGWRKPPYQEPYAMPGEEPQRFERLCFRALAEGAISEAKAAELLETSVHELNQRMEEPPDLEYDKAHEGAGLRHVHPD